MTSIYNNFEPIVYPRIIIYPSDECSVDIASKIAKELKSPLSDYSAQDEKLSNFDFSLAVSREGLILRQIDSGLTFSLDFSRNSIKYRVRSNRSELLGRAIGIKSRRPKKVIDGTAGFGMDSFILANLGCSLVLCERNVIIATMLSHAIESAKRSTEPWLAESASRMSLMRQDVRSLPTELVDNVDVIYLDPMFPEKRNNAASKKEIKILRSLQPNVFLDIDQSELLKWALDQNVKRIVLKRPIRAKVIGEKSLSHQLLGKIIRYDVYQRLGK